MDYIPVNPLLIFLWYNIFGMVEEFKLNESNAEKVLFVRQGEYVTASKDSILSTGGLGSCPAIYLYPQDKNYSALTHLDADTCFNRAIQFNKENPEGQKREIINFTNSYISSLKSSDIKSKYDAIVVLGSSSVDSGSDENKFLKSTLNNSILECIHKIADSVKVFKSEGARYYFFQGGEVTSMVFTPMFETDDKLVQKLQDSMHDQFTKDRFRRSELSPSPRKKNIEKIILGV